MVNSQTNQDIHMRITEAHATKGTQKSKKEVLRQFPPKVFQNIFLKTRSPKAFLLFHSSVKSPETPPTPTLTPHIDNTIRTHQQIASKHTR